MSVCVFYGCNMFICEWYTHQQWKRTQTLTFVFALCSHTDELWTRTQTHTQQMVELLIIMMFWEGRMESLQSTIQWRVRSSDGCVYAREICCMLCMCEIMICILLKVFNRKGLNPFNICFTYVLIGFAYFLFNIL